MLTFAEILDDAMHYGRELKIQTKNRGELIGTPDAVDEYNSDPDRWGYYLAIGADKFDTVFLDEITAINVTYTLENMRVRDAG